MVLLVLGAGCFLNRRGWLGPETRVLHGTIVRIDERPEYELPCPTLTHVLACDIPPVCCAYRIYLATDSGPTRTFMAFWGTQAEGLKVGEDATFVLHRHPIYRLPCTVYGCIHDVDYSLESDNDVNPPQVRR